MPLDIPLKNNKTPTDGSSQKNHLPPEIRASKEQILHTRVLELEPKRKDPTAVQNTDLLIRLYRSSRVLSFRDTQFLKREIYSLL